MSLDETPEWKRIAQTWDEATAVASKAHGDYPFDRAGKQDLIQRISAALDDVSALAVAETISMSEASLLGREIGLLVERVSLTPTVEEKGLHFDPPPYKALASVSASHLAERTAHLEQLAAAGTPNPHIFAKIVGTMERDIAVLRDEDALGELARDERAQAIEFRDRAAKALASLRR